MKMLGLAKKKDSQVLVAAVIVLAISFALGVALLFHSRSFRDVARLQTDTDQAYALAKSGIGIGESFVANDPSIQQDETYNLGEGTVEIGIASTAAFVDGDYVVTGTITSTGRAGGSVRLFQKAFQIILPPTWVRVYGGTAEDRLMTAQETAGGYLFSGWSNSFGDRYQFLIIETDPLGNRQYSRTIGNNLADEKLHQLWPVSDGYIMSGSYDFAGVQFITVKTDSSWNVQGYSYPYLYIAPWWNPNYTLFLVQPINGGYICAVTLEMWQFGSTRTVDFYLFKIGSDRRLAYSPDPDYTYGGYGTDILRDLYPINNGDNGYILAGTTNSSGAGGDDFLVIRVLANLSVDGAKTKTYGGSGNDQLWCLKPTSDGGYILAGRTSSFGLTNAFLLIKTDANANLDTSFGTTGARAYTVSGAECDEVVFVQQTADGGYILGGSTLPAVSSDILLIKINSQGTPRWAKRYGGASLDQLYALQQTSDGGYILGGRTQSFGAGGDDCLAIKTDSSGNVVSCSIAQDIPLSQITATEISPSVNNFTTVRWDEDAGNNQFESGGGVCTPAEQPVCPE